MDGMSREHAQDLRSILQWDREKAKGVLTALNGAAKKIKDHIRQEMEEKHEFTWEVSYS
jgi:hypothetical protein